jgi:hypothetical protein
VKPLRGVLTLVAVAGAALLIWLSTQLGGSVGAYWAKIGLLAAAGLVLPLAQLFGGWTKWGWPRLSTDVLLLGFLPALIVAGWVILAGQPAPNWFQRHVVSWSGDLHVARLVRHLRESYLDVLAFGLGVLFGFSFDTTGPRVARAALPPPAAGPAPEPWALREEPTPYAPPPADTAPTRVSVAAEETRAVPAADTAPTRLDVAEEKTVAAPPENPPTES